MSNILHYKLLQPFQQVMQDVSIDQLQWGQMHELLKRAMQTGKETQLDYQLFEHNN